MTTLVIYVVIASTLACSLSVYAAIQLYMDLERMKKEDQIRRDVENARIEMFNS